MIRRVRTWTCMVLLTLTQLPARAWAESSSKATLPDRYALDVRSDTYLELYRRALLPGPGGALVTTETHAPLHEYASFAARGLDLPGAPDSVDVELSAWGRAELGNSQEFQPVDGDLRVANVRYRKRGLFVEVGRQTRVGGAARFARLDGVSAGNTWDNGFAVQAYAGFSVRQLAFQRPGYRLLGAAPEALLRNPELLEPADPKGNWLLGAQLSYEKPASWGVAATVHEQREGGELARRNVGLDTHFELSSKLSLLAATVVDLDSASVADARAFLDYAPSQRFDVGAEYLHTEPALFLSRQSVLSVFSTDNFDEAGASARYRPLRSVEFGAGAYFDAYSHEDPGGRLEARARFKPVGTDRTLVMLTLSRVRNSETGYQALRAALRQRLLDPLVATAETYLYFYDHPIHGYESSSVYAGTLEWQVLSELRCLWGASVARTPNAGLDTQTMLRISYERGRRSTR